MKYIKQVGERTTPNLLTLPPPRDLTRLEFRPFLSIKAANAMTALWCLESLRISYSM